MPPNFAAKGKASPASHSAPSQKTVAPSRSRLPANQALLRLQRHGLVTPRDDASEREADAFASRVLAARPAADRSDDNTAKPAGALTPAGPTDSSATALVTGGTPLSDSLRSFFESRVGHDLSAVRVHADHAAETAARSVHAMAFTYGSHIWLGREHSAAPNEVLAHELAHVIQQTGERPPAAAAPDHGATGVRRDRHAPAATPRPGHPVVQRKPRAPGSRQPFEKTLQLNAAAATALAALLRQLRAIPQPTKPLQERIDAIEQLAAQAERERAGGEQVVAAYAAGEDVPPDVLVEVGYYLIDERPSTRGLERLQRRALSILALIEIVSLRALKLTQTADALGDTAVELREAFHTVAGYYLDLLQRAQDPDIFDQLQFLDLFYRDPRLIQGYGLWAYIRAQLPDIYDNLVKASQAGTYTTLLNAQLKSGDPRFSAADISELQQKGLQGKRAAQVKITANAVRNLKRGEEMISVLPATLGEVRTLPGVESNAALLQAFIDIQVRVAVLRLWQPIEPLQSLLYSTNNAGQSLLPFSAQDRDRWFKELNTLEIEFAAELDRTDHPGIDGKVDAWLKRIQRLIDEIPPEVRQKQIIALIVEQIPFMFVAGATAARMGMWVRAATQSRWIAALAEGATMTLFTAMGTPANAPNRPQTALGWTANFAVNVFLAGVGRLFFEAGDFAARAAFSRAALAAFTSRVMVPTVVLSGLQSGVQLIEARIGERGGETSFTELLTLNLVLNAIGMIVGATTMMPERGRGSAPSRALARPTAPELARQFNIPEEHARLLLEVADRFGDFQATLNVLNKAASEGTLNRAQFEAMRKQGADLADFLEARLEPLCRAGAFGAATPAQMKATLAAFRSRLGALNYESLLKVTALLPESTTGLVRIGDGPQWGYSREKPPSGLAALRSDYEKRGNTVRALPSGGWQASDPKGNLLAQVVPLSAQAVQALAKNLASVATGPLGRQGLEKVRSQTGVPVHLLEAQLEQALSSPGGERSVPRVLQRLARFVEPTNDAAWLGLSQYLTHVGDAPLLARAMTFATVNEFAAENRLLINSLLPQMATWDSQAFFGFKTMYELRPNMTGERLLSLIKEYQPEQVKEILRSITFLAPRSKGLGKVIGPLTSSSEMSRRGAMGALTTGVLLAGQHPSATLVFEEPVLDAGGEVVRVIDISVQETRVTRVAGETKTEMVEVAAVEVKEISTASLGRRAVQELARDIARDSAVRAQRLTPVGASRPFFETFMWRIRGLEIRQLAIDALKNPAASEAEIDAKMRDIVAKQLQKVFDRPEFKALPQAEQDGYRAAFNGVPFVQFF